MIEKVKAQAQQLKSQVSNRDLNQLLTQSSDLLLVACVGAMVGMMIVPLPTWLSTRISRRRASRSRSHRAGQSTIEQNNC